MVAGAEVGALGDADTIADGDGGEVVEPGVFRQPAGLAYLQTPGEFHAQAGLEAATGADLGPEGAQQPHAPGGAGQPAGAEQGAPTQNQRVCTNKGASGCQSGGVR